MSKHLLIVGAGAYGLVAKEIAESMRAFDRIAFLDDAAKTTPNGTPVLGTVADAARLCDAGEYDCVAVAIGNPGARLSLLRRLREQTSLSVVSLVSPMAYVSPDARVGDGAIVEPMAVIHSGCELGEGCIVSAGAVINHMSLCGEGVHVDCNATVPGYVTVPARTKVYSGTVFG